MYYNFVHNNTEYTAENVTVINILGNRIRTILGSQKFPGDGFTFHLRSNKELYEKF